MKKLKKYDLHQCALYKCKSKKKLAELLFVGLKCLKNSEDFIKYNSFWIDSNKERLVNAPQPYLKKIQKRLFILLQPINRPAWVMFGEKGKSYVKNAAEHQCSHYCVTMDIKGFYDNCSRDAVYRFCMGKLQTSPDVAAILTDFTTWEHHIPTGSPVSQLIAYHAYEDMFCEINSYTKSIGARFTLCVDDMTISSKNPIDPKEIVTKVEEILHTHGHMLNKEKSKYYSSGDFKLITGVAISPAQQLMVPNKLSYKICQEMAHILSINQPISSIGTSRLNGQLQAARAIQPDYRSDL